MALAVIMVLMSMTVFTQASGCLEGQQCSDCSRTGDCKSKCFWGYFGVTCKAHCTEGCLNGACETSETGIGRCTEGCVPGYQGTDCTSPCARQEATCTKCQSECDQDYCQLTSSCVPGCVDGYYSSDCKNCSSKCKTCNRITGTCDECYPLYTGADCHYSGLCEAGCTEGCGRQLSGSFCVEVCSHNCKVHTNMTDTTRCLPPGVNASVYCTSECHNQTGECLHGCIEGWYGPRCLSPCNAGCRGGRCDAAGVCVEGCINETCSDERLTGISESAHGLNIGLPSACVLFVLTILVSNYVCYRKGHTKQRKNLADVECSPVVEYQPSHKYSDIEEGDLEQPTENQANLEEELGLAKPTIADVFPPAVAIVHRGDDMSSESSASSTYESYTHLISDVVTDDPGTVDSYISPVVELTLHPHDP